MEIQPFRAVRPNPIYADQLVFTSPQAESVAGDGMEGEFLPPLKTLLETGARLRPELPENQARAYHDINDRLHNLVQTSRLCYEDTPGIYVYEVEHSSYRQTGIWALTKLEGNGTIKTHELTFDDSVRRMKNYREHTGLEGSPILLTYHPDMTINQIIEKVKAQQKPTTLSNDNGVHRLWKIEDPGLLAQLTSIFAGIKTVYLADGHHRLESATKLANEQEHRGQHVYDTLASLYMASDQLVLQPYDRAIIPPPSVDMALFLQDLTTHFEVSKQWDNKPVRPRQAHHAGLYIAGEWYNLIFKPHTYEGRCITESIDAAILQEQVLAPVFGITDPKTDPHLKCIGGGKAIEELLAFIAEHTNAVVFTLCPLTVEQIISVSEAGKTLPPKSTWIDPKVPYGILLNGHDLHHL